MKRFRFSARAAVLCSLILAIGIPSVAVGFGEGHNLLLGRRNPSYPNATSKETQIISEATTYGTRQSNIRNGDGGGAIYGCRSASGHEPCVRANNLNSGRAFEFATDGKEGGRITTKDTNGAPFTTNATGVATGLNADRVDGHDAGDFATATDFLFAAVTDAATPTFAGRGLSSVTKNAAAGTFAVTFNKDVSKCSYTTSPVGNAASVSPGVAPLAGSPNAVTVSFNIGSATTPPTQSFHLQVIC